MVRGEGAPGEGLGGATSHEVTFVSSMEPCCGARSATFFAFDKVNFYIGTHKMEAEPEAWPMLQI